MTIDAIDFGTAATVTDVKILSWGSPLLKITTRNGIVTSEVLTDGVYGFKAGRKGYKTSIHPVEIVCRDGKAHATLNLLAGEKSEEIYVLPDGNRIDSSGVAVFPKDLYLIGKSWWKPLSPRACSSDCEVNFSVEIDEFGKVTSATMLTGGGLYRKAVEKALKTWEFYPVYHEGKAFKAKGIMQILFNQTRLLTVAIFGSSFLEEFRQEVTGEDAAQVAILTGDEKTDQMVRSIVASNRLTAAGIRLRRACIFNRFDVEMKNITKNLRLLTDSMLLGEDVRTELSLIGQSVTQFEQKIEA